MRHPTLALADVHRATTELDGRIVDVFIFDHHRTAFTLWCHAAKERGGALTLLTLDRHFDFEPAPADVPAFTSSLAELDLFARHRLEPSNDNHVRAAMQSGAIDDALAIARSHAPSDLGTLALWHDADGRAHRLIDAPTLDRRPSTFDDALDQAHALVFDVDLDCFTTRSDAHPDEVLAWDGERIEAFLAPPGTEHFWAAVRKKTQLITLAREPFHSGGFAQAARLWLDFSEVFFERILRVPAP